MWNIKTQPYPCSFCRYALRSKYAFYKLELSAPHSNGFVFTVVIFLDWVSSFACDLNHARGRENAFIHSKVYLDESENNDLGRNLNSACRYYFSRLYALRYAHMTEARHKKKSKEMRQICKSEATSRC